MWVDFDLYGLSVGVWTCHTCYGLVAKFHPVSYGGSFRFSFVLTPVSKAFGYRIFFTKGFMFLFVSLKAKYIWYLVISEPFAIF